MRHPALRTEVLTLVSVSHTVDLYGDLVATETTRDVFCEVASIGEKEFYQAQAVGLQPTLKFILADYLEYEDEPVVKYNGERFRVLRTFRNGQELEITVIREINPPEATTA